MRKQVLGKYVTIVVAFLLFGWGAASAPLESQTTTYPDRPVKLVVGFSAGGDSDIVARLLASSLEKVLGQSVVVENRTGAGGIIAAATVAKAPPDGYTLIVSSIGPLTVAPHIVSNLPYNPATDFEPISLLTSSEYVLVASPSVGARTLSEFTALAGANPNTLSIASTGVGSAGHLAIELYKLQSGVEVVHVPYRNSGAISPDLLSGRVSAAFAPIARVVQNIASGILIGLASTGAKRSVLAPDVPTFAELGYDRVMITDWYALLAPSGTPRTVLDSLNADVGKVLSASSMRTRLASYGFESIPSTREKLKRRMQTESKVWSHLMREAGMSVP